MSAAEALLAARTVGVSLKVDGPDLVLEAAAPPPAAVLKLLSRHKAVLMMLLRSGDDGWSAEDWQAYYGERAGIAEFDGGLQRAEAERMAFECCVAEWLNRNVDYQPPGTCAACSFGVEVHYPLSVHGDKPPGQDGSHSPCCSACHARKRADAITAFRASGIMDGART